MKVLRDKYCHIAKTSARRTLRLRLRENPSIRKSLLELVFSLFSRRERIRHARLWRENSPSPAEEAVASFKVRSPKSAIFGGGKYTIVFLRRGFLSFCGRTPFVFARRKAEPPKTYFKALGQRGHHATLSALIRSRCLLIRKMRTPHFRGNARKSVVLLRFITLYSMCLQHRNVCEAPLCGSMSKHFTCPLVAQRFEGTFHVFAKAKTFHFCAEDMLAYCDFVIVAPILITFMPDRRL